MQQFEIISNGQTDMWLIAIAVLMVAPSVVSGDVHPYILDHYLSTTDGRGNVRQNVDLTQLRVIGFMEDRELGGLEEETIKEPCRQSMTNVLNMSHLRSSFNESNTMTISNAKWRFYLQPNISAGQENSCSYGRVAVQLSYGNTRRTVEILVQFVGGWVEVDMRDVINSILRDDTAGLGRVELTTSLTCVGSCESLDVQMVQASAAQRNAQPILAVHLFDSQSEFNLPIKHPASLTSGEGNVSRSGESNRHRRSSPHHNKHCRRRPFYVDFTKVDMFPRSVLFPDVYDVGICEGSCSPDYFLSVQNLDTYLTNHAHLLAHVARNRVTVNCVPVSYEAVSVVLNEGSVLENSIYANMKVKDCGCR